MTKKLTIEFTDVGDDEMVTLHVSDQSLTSAAFIQAAAVILRTVANCHNKDFDTVLAAVVLADQESSEEHIKTLLH